MSCGTPCSASNVGPVVQSPAVSPSTPANTQCVSEGFCDDRLEGLPRRSGIDLIGVQPGESCFVRPNYSAGLWQHDPSRPSGPDYVGPLARMEFLAGEKAAFGHLIVAVEELKDYGDGNPQPILVVKPIDVGNVTSGDLTVLVNKECEDGTDRWSYNKLSPQAYPSSCPDNLQLLSYIDSVVNGQTVREWIGVDALKLPTGQIQHFGDTDLEDANTYRMLVAKRTGSCTEIGTMATPSFKTECDELPEADTAKFFNICNAGVAKRFGPKASGDPSDQQNIIVGQGTDFQRIPRGLMFYPLSSPDNLVSSPSLATPVLGTTAVSIPGEVAPPIVGGTVWGVFSVWHKMSAGNNQGEIQIDIGGVLAVRHQNTDKDGMSSQVLAPIDGDTVDVEIIGIDVDGNNEHAYEIDLIGYFA